MAEMNARKFLRAEIAALAAVGIFAAGALQAEDVVVTRQQTYRGTVKSVNPKSIQFEIPGMGAIDIPRNAVVQIKVEPPPSITRGIAAYENGNLREARQTLDRIAFQYQGLDLDWAMKALVYFGWACLAGDDVKTAEKAFQAFIEAYPDEDLAVNARLGLAEIELRNKNYDKILPELQEMAKPFDAQIKPPAEQIPLAGGIYLAIGKTYEGLQQLPQALEAFLRVIALYPDEKSYPEALYHAGVIFNQQGKYAQAEKMLSELTDNYPSHTLAQSAGALLQEVRVKAKAASEKPAESSANP